jgi:hypothetical protein
MRSAGFRIEESDNAEHPMIVGNERRLVSRGEMLPSQISIPYSFSGNDQRRTVNVVVVRLLGANI